MKNIGGGSLSNFKIHKISQNFHPKTVLTRQVILLGLGFKKIRFNFRSGLRTHQKIPATYFVIIKSENLGLFNLPIFTFKII